MKTVLNLSSLFVVMIEYGCCVVSGEDLLKKELRDKNENEQ